MCQETTPTQAALNPAPVDRSADGLRRLLLGGAGRVFAMKVTGIALSFGISVALARLLGTKGFGTYAYALMWVAVLRLPASGGFERLLVREVARSAAQQNWSAIRGILRWTGWVTLGLAVAVGVIAGGIAWVIAGRTGSAVFTTFLAALVMLPLTALSLQRQAAMRGLHCTTAGQLPEILIKPAMFGALVAAAGLLCRDRLTATGAMGLHIVAAAAALGIGSWLLTRRVPRHIAEAIPSYRPSAWIGSALPMLAIGGMHMLNMRTDIIMLGAIKGMGPAGVYHAASRGAQFIAFAILSLNIVLAPTIADLYARGETARLQRIITRSARVVALASAAIAACLILARGPFMRAFGPDFADGRVPLVILCVGQLINAGTGSVGVLLAMTGHERDAAVGTAVGAGLNLLLNAALIPIWHVTGAAIATAISISVMNVLMSWLVWRRLGLHATALGALGKRGGYDA